MCIRDSGGTADVQSDTPHVVHHVVIYEHIAEKGVKPVILIDFFVCQPAVRMDSAPADVVDEVVFDIYVCEDVGGTGDESAFDAAYRNSHDVAARARRTHRIVDDIDIFIFIRTDVIVIADNARRRAAVAVPAVLPLDVDIQIADDEIGAFVKYQHIPDVPVSYTHLLSFPFLFAFRLL